MKKKVIETASAMVAAFSLSIMSEISMAHPLMKEPRQLRVTMSTTSGRACRSNCIDEGQFFCVSKDFQDGVCCDTTSENCR